MGSGLGFTVQGTKVRGQSGLAGFRVLGKWPEGFSTFWLRLQGLGSTGMLPLTPPTPTGGALQEANPPAAEDHEDFQEEEEAGGR